MLNLPHHTWLGSRGTVNLETEMEKFLFGEGSEKPAGYVAPDSDA